MQPGAQACCDRRQIMSTKARETKKSSLLGADAVQLSIFNQEAALPSLGRLTLLQPSLPPRLAALSEHLASFWNRANLALVASVSLRSSGEHRVRSSYIHPLCTTPDMPVPVPPCSIERTRQVQPGRHRQRSPDAHVLFKMADRGQEPWPHQGAEALSPPAGRSWSLDNF